MLFCSTLTPVYANNTLGEAIDYISAAGIEYEYNVETIQPDQNVTKAVFAQNVIKLLNMSEIECNNVYYHDVSEDHWAFDSIGMLTELGVISGNGSKYFYPDEYITRDEAATIIVAALGYRMYANNAGGFPYGYLKVANELELFEDCTFENSELTLSNATIMLRNALDANIANTKMSQNELVYAKSDDTVLNYYHNKYYGKGTLTAGDGITFQAPYVIEDGYAIIDGIEYTTKLTGLIDYIGTDVEFLYEAEAADSDERELVWVKSRGRSQSIDIKKDEYCRFDSEQYTFYYSDGGEKTKKLNISEGIIVIYNGAISTRSVAEVLNLDKYDVRFVKSNGSTQYDIAIVWEYQNMVAGMVDTNDHIIYDKFGQGRMLDISDDREKIIVEGGRLPEQIETGDILSYYESEDGRLLKIDISKTVTEVTAKWIRDDSGKKVLIADGGEYTFYDNDASATVLNGETVKLYLDKNGYIVNIERVKADGFPAYLIKATYDESDEILILKTLDYDGNIEKRRVEEKAKFDGTKTELDVIYSMITADGTTRQQVVVLKVNENGLISSIDTTEVGSRETQDATLRCHERNYRGQYKHHGRLVPKYLISQSTTIFSVPSVASGDDRDYLVKHKSDMSNDQWYTFDIYRYSQEAVGYEEIMVIKDKQWGLSGGNDKLYVLVDEIIGVLNADGDAVEEMTFNRQGADSKATTIPEFSLLDMGVKSGDLVQLSMNMRGEIEDAEIKYSYGSDERPINTAYNAEPGLRVVYAHETVGNVLRIGHDSGADFDEIFEVMDKDIVIYDEDADPGEKIRPGTMWDILDYISFGESCSTVAIQTIDESPWSVVVYK